MLDLDKGVSTGMLVLLTSQWRQQAAAVLVALYALCLLAPVTAFAFSDSSLPAHCQTITDEHQAVGDGQGHQESVDQSRARHDNNDHGLPGHCCGLFCVSAITPTFELIIAPVPHASGLTALAVKDLFGRSSNGIDRPPRVLPFV